MRRSVQAAIAILVPICFFFGAICLIGVSAQRRQRRPPVNRQPITRTATIDYSKFSHTTKKHQGACNTCHKVPTDNWKKAGDFPDVADYPGHDACVGCHRPQFFKGAKPVICSVCHSKVSPRDDARFAFRNPVTSRQFLIEFPHDKHQDVIAQLKLPKQPAQTAQLFTPITAKQTAGLRAWSHTRVVATGPSQTNSLLYRSAAETQHYNNCEICHGPRTGALAPPATGWTDSFVPDAATFRAVPTSHAACFNCHWKTQQPVSANCAGCHKLSEKPYQASVADVPKRLSVKFRHAREQHVQECTTCHINITKATTLRGLQPDVPITSCTECHNKEGLRQDVSKELEAIDKNRDFVCGYCHTSEVGRLDPPPGHYLIAGRAANKRKDVK
jgi:hypothetical protein